MSYDPDNILAKILRKEIPCDTVHEDEHTLALRDIAPQAKIHVLVIPKGAYRSYDEFLAKATEPEILAFMRAIQTVIGKEGLAEGGYRLVMNNGRNGRQEIPHLHCHVLGGSPLGGIA